MALGALTIVEQAAAVGSPVRFFRCTLVGDGAYSAGGSTGLLAKLRDATKSPGLSILSVKDEGVAAVAVEYDHTNEKVFVRTKSSGAEDTTSNQSGTTYDLFIVAT